MASASQTAAHPFHTRPYSKLPDRSAGAAFAQSYSQPPPAPLQQQQQHQQQQAPQPSAHQAPPQQQSSQQRAAREALARDGPAALAQLSEEQKEEVGEAFALFDLDKDRRVDYHEFKVAMKALGFDVPKAEVLGLLQTHGEASVSVAGSGAAGAGAGAGALALAHPLPDAPYRHSKLLLGHTAFVHIMALRILARDPRDEVLRAFELFDGDGKGKISLADLRRVARELGEGLQEEELAAMIEEFDLDGDGCIDREEFLGICLG